MEDRRWRHPTDQGHQHRGAHARRQGHRDGHHPQRPIDVAYKIAGGTATAGSDHTAVNGSLSFDAGDATKTVAVGVLGDDVDEANETLNLVLSAPSSGTLISDGSGAATVVDDEGPITPAPATFLSVDDVLLTQGDSGSAQASFTIRRSGDTSGTSTVKYKTGGGTATAGADYTPVGTTVPPVKVSFAPAETAKTVIVDVIDDGLPDANETLNLTLAAPSGAVIADAAGSATIVNDDGSVYIAVDNVWATEGSSGTAATFTVTRSGNTAGTSTVRYKTSGGTATPGSDYAALALTSLTFDPGGHLSDRDGRRHR